MMNIYLVTNPNVSGDEPEVWNVYGGFVVLAETPEEAANTHPMEFDMTGTREQFWTEGYNGWVPSPSDVEVVHLGTADKPIPAGIVLIDYRAG